MERISITRPVPVEETKEEKEEEKKEMVSDSISLRSIPCEPDEESMEEKQLDASDLGITDTNMTAKSSMRNQRIAKRRLGSAR